MLEYGLRIDGLPTYGGGMPGKYGYESFVPKIIENALILAFSDSCSVSIECLSVFSN